MMIAAVKSGSGKTTITCALLKQLQKRGKNLLSFKCGPDFIDPMFHEQILQIPSRNLDSYFSSEEQVRALFLLDQSGSQISVVEGVMGLYDGLGGIREEGSTYHLAGILQIPIVLVVDAHGMGRSVIALLAGFLQYDRRHLIHGVILNRTSKMFCASIAPEIERELGIKVYGCVPGQKELNLKSRHLGLVMPEEIETVENTLARAGMLMEENVDIDGILALAESAEEMEMSESQINKSLYGEPCGDQNLECETKKIRIAIARDEAFCFYYRDNLKILEHFGAELVPFSPLHDRKLPEHIRGLILGGGYPELYGEELSENKEMREAVAAAIRGGLPSFAECGGFMYLHENLTDEHAQTYPMVGVIPADVSYVGRLVRFGYMELAEKIPMFLPEHTGIRGHEFHYYDSTANGTDCLAKKPVTGRAWECVQEERNHFWGFPHLYYASNTAFAKHFIDECLRRPALWANTGSALHLK